MIIHYKNRVVFLDKVVCIEFETFEEKIRIRFLYEADWQNCISINTNIPYKEIFRFKNIVTERIVSKKNEIDIFQIERDVLEEE